MPISHITDYLDNLLLPKLKASGVNNSFCWDLRETVETQMYSALRHWDELPFRKALLLIASEEGLFYEPVARSDIKNFVVLTLRNSPFETLQSADYLRTGIAKSLTNQEVKAFTSAAVMYFNRLDFSYLCNEAKACEKQDVYAEAAVQFPVAWNALTHLAMSKAKTMFYDRFPSPVPYELPVIKPQETTPGRLLESHMVLDGFSQEIDEALAGILRTVVDEKGVFLVNSFKMLSRNIIKILSVIEYLLTRDLSFATVNYYLENGYAEQRSTILRAAHSTKEGEVSFRNLRGLGPKHTFAIKQYLRNNPSP